jgi:hypothetical protein
MILNINFDSIEEIALLGIRRAYYFSSLTYSQDNLNSLKQYPLYAGFIVFPEQSAENFPDVKKAFSQFVANNCLREIIEAVSAFLDQIYYSLLLFHTCRDESDIENAKKATEEFSWFTFPSKLRKLNQKLAVDHKIPKDDIKFLMALQRLRNCLSHARGKIDDNGGVDLEYPCFSIVGVASDGERCKVDLDNMPFMLPKPMQLEVSFIKEKRHFKKDEIISIDAKQMAFICYGAQKVCRDIKIKAMRTAESLGVPVNKAPDKAELTSQ